MNDRSVMDDSPPGGCGCKHGNPVVATEKAPPQPHSAMLLYCPGHDCPLCADCYRHTQPSPGRDAIAALPYDAATGTCEWFYSNEPEEAMVCEAAYYVWLRNGCPENRDVEHWEEAYRGLCRSMGRVIE